MLSLSSRPLVWIICGEPSGDLLASSIVTALRQQYPETRFQGISGPLTEQAGGFVSLFPYTDLCHMGIGSVLRHGVSLAKRYWQTLQAIGEQRPDLLLTIDCPDFSLRVSQKVRAPTQRVHCVAPSVWAWRKKRADTLKQKTDYLLHLFKFEKNFFPQIPCFWVGHPLADQEPAHKDTFWSAYPQFSPGYPLICILPGSRAQEIQQCWPVFKETVENLTQHKNPIQKVVVTLPKYVEQFNQAGYTTVTDPALKNSVFANTTAALACSGTVTLELALQRTPMVIGYKVHPVVAWILQRMVSTPYVGLVNILAEGLVAPECLQNHFTPKHVAAALESVLQTSAEAKSCPYFHKVWSNVKTPLGFSATSARILTQILGLVKSES